MEFEAETQERIRRNGQNHVLQKISAAWLETADACQYEYNFTWLGLPVIQYPTDLVGMQEIIWKTRPDLIIETGIARGGSLIFYASLLQLLGGDRKVIGIDIDIRPPTRQALESHPLYPKLHILEGSSTAPEILTEVRRLTRGKANILVCLDANHSHAHVTDELDAYASLVCKGNYVVVFDTSIEDLWGNGYPDRPWGRGDNPKTAVWSFLKRNQRFRIDRAMENKLMLTSAPSGFLQCVEDPE